MTAPLYKIGNVVTLLGISHHMLRNWEKALSPLKPVKHKGGRRYYTEEHLILLRQIKQMLSEGYTLSGISKALKTQKEEEPVGTSLFQVARTVLKGLESLQEDLKNSVRNPPS